MINSTDCEFLSNLTGLLNQTNSTMCGDNELVYEKPDRIIVGAMFTLCSWIILTNGLVVICFVASTNTKKNLMNVQVLSLSFTDLLVGFSTLVVTLNYQSTRLFTFHELCLAVFGFYVSAQIASFYHTFCICLYRFVTVFFRLKSSRRHEGMTMKSTMIQVLIVWFVASIIAFTPSTVFGRWGSTLRVCSLNLLFQDGYNLTLSIWNISLLAPQIVINIMYISIYLKLRHTMVKVETIPNSIHLNTTSNIRTEESVPKQSKLLHEPKFIESKTDNMLKVPQHRPVRLTNSIKNNPQHLSPKTSKQEDTALPDNQSGIKYNKTLDSHANLPSGSRQKMDHDACHKLDSVDKSSYKVFFITGKNVTRQSRGQPLDSQVSRPRNSRTPDNKHSNILVTIGLVLLVLDICLTPLNILFVLESLQEGFLSRRTKFLILTFSLFNSGINPIIYAFRIKQLRQTIKKGWCHLKSYLLN